MAHDLVARQNILISLAFTLAHTLNYRVFLAQFAFYPNFRALRHMLAADRTPFFFGRVLCLLSELKEPCTTR